MSRSPVSRFAYVQSDINMKRSRFDRNHRHLTTFSAGHLYPIFADEVLPGDTFSLDTSVVCRMSTPIHPTLDNCYLDLMFFYCPNRILWDHWKSFMGESPEDPYLNPIEYSVPMLRAPYGNDPGGIPPKSILDYLGIPSYTLPEEVSALPVRAFCKIWNEWFRDQNLQNAIALDTGDSELKYSDHVGSAEEMFWDNNNATDPDAYVINAAHGGDLPPVNKYHDYFTSALREPQKGDPVPIPLSGFAPVYANALVDLGVGISNPVDFKFIEDGDDVQSASLGINQLGHLASSSSTSYNSQDNIYPSNLGADLSMIAGVYSTINDLRYAFQLQKFLDADGRSGTRYRELLKAHFGVTSPDASQQVPEFLGGKRIPINISQVLQTSSTDDVSPQGNTAAYSLTSDKFNSFTKSFTEHGWIIGVACVRTEHTYCQGIEKMWSRKNKFDFYFPEFANISEQPIYNKEIFNIHTGSDSFNKEDAWIEADEVFGYQEAWAEYRYKPNRVSGEFRPTYGASLDSWHYGDYYDEQPYLSSEWIRETRKNIDRTLAVSSDVADQFIADFYFKLGCTRVMPVTSIPGLADHH